MIPDKSFKNNTEFCNGSKTRRWNHAQAWKRQA